MNKQKNRILVITFVLALAILAVPVMAAGAATQIAIQAALTGHLVLSTIHTNSAPATITRLIDMGVEPFLIASSLICVLSQRLVRRLCEER